MTETLKLQIPIYRETLHVFFGSIEDCQAALIKDGISEEDALAWSASKTLKGSYRYYTEKEYCLLWLPCMPESVAEFGALVHEILHFVFHLMSLRGLELNGGSEEAYTYLTEFVYCELLTYITSQEECRETDT